jgi:hypothetical protein
MTTEPHSLSFCKINTPGNEERQKLRTEDVVHKKDTPTPVYYLSFIDAPTFMSDLCAPSRFSSKRMFVEIHSSIISINNKRRRTVLSFANSKNGQLALGFRTKRMVTTRFYDHCVETLLRNRSYDFLIFKKCPLAEFHNFLKHCRVVTSYNFKLVW